MTRDYPSAVLANLRRGRDGARSLSELAEALGCPRRVLERSVQELRRRGHPIASGNEGVWLEATSEGMFEVYRSLRGRALEQLRTASAVKRTAFRHLRHEQNFEQELLWVDLPEVAA